MIGIREPKYKVGDRVLEIGNPKSGVWAVQQIIEYDFTIDLYRYLLIHADGINLFASEKNLKPYIEKPKSVWDLKEGDTYYVISGYGEVLETTWKYNIDSNSRKIGNAFLTKEEAEFEVERRKVETEMIRLGGHRSLKLRTKNYFITHEHVSGNILRNSTKLIDYQGSIYFDSEEELKEAVETIGEDRAERYIFGVES